MKTIGKILIVDDITVDRITATDANVLILGESGTGKDLIADKIHEKSIREHKPFVKVDIAWQKLIRVLTHEIMNASAPIISSTETIREILVNQDTGKPFAINNLQNEDIVDIVEGINIISDESSSLRHFVQNYRTLTKLPIPDFEIINVGEYLQSIARMYRKQAHDNNVIIETSNGEKDILLRADKKLLTRVMNNLIKNAFDALNQTVNPCIRLCFSVNENKSVEITVSDNGQGIATDVMEQIFTPFYSTKSNGSGIGLSLARQIMRLHGANISVLSTPGIETKVVLLF